VSAAGRRLRRGGRADDASTAELLATGEVELKGRIPWSSNATFLVEVSRPDAEGPDAEGPDAEGPDAEGPEAEGSVLAIYKPARGERPLWDFDRGLWRREVAAYQLARHLGWGLVPLTVARHDGPLGPGSLQLFVDACADEHYFTLLENPARHDQLRRIAAFDLVINNADRKSGHCLLGPDGRIWGIDHGLAFHAEPKLRTVIWDFAGQRVDDSLLADVDGVAGGDVPEEVGRLLSDDEVAAMVSRATSLVRRRKFPRPVGDFPYPWPLI
jgi:uncharacterized repeat protein (TIGR03843 family)